MPKSPKPRFIDNGPKVEILSMPDSGPIKPAVEGGEETASSGLWTFDLPSQPPSVDTGEDDEE